MNRTGIVARAFVSSAILIPLGLVVSTSITVMRLIRQLPVYESTAQLRYPSPGSSDTFESFRIVQNTYAATIVSPAWISETRKQLKRPDEEINRKLVKIAAIPIDQTSIISLTAQSLDPVFSADFANAWAMTVIKFYGTNEDTRPAVIRAAVPSGAPTTPRKLHTIARAAMLGIAIGLLLSVVSTTVIYSIRSRGEQCPRP